MDNKSHQNSNINLPQPVSDSKPLPGSADLPMQPLDKPTTPAPVPAAPKAQDADTIEAEWVSAVEKLMQQMANDPAQLSQEFSKLKARYMSERYGKELKGSNGQGQ